MTEAGLPSGETGARNAGTAAHLGELGLHRITPAIPLKRWDSGAQLHGSFHAASSGYR
jgi:hypothetical protein